MKLSEQRYLNDVMESIEQIKKQSIKDGIPVLPLSTIAGMYAIRFLNPQDCAHLLNIELKIINGYDKEIEI